MASRCQNAAFCPSDTYPDASTSTCEQCHSTCLECSGPTNLNCNKCDTGRYLQAGICKLSCSGATFENSVTNTCDACDGTCDTCTGPSSTECTSCTGARFLEGTECKLACTALNKYENGATNTCDSCDSSCKECNGPGTTNCLDCYTGRSLNGSNECINVCVNTKEFYNTPTVQCEPCHPSCSTCSGFLNSECFSCENGFFLENSTTCVASCTSDSEFENAGNNRCDSCHSTCKTCSASTKNDCLSCNIVRFLESSKCRTACSLDNLFENSITNKCDSCHSLC